MIDVVQYRATCFHEAAHAVFALKVCGGSLQCVSADESYCAAKTSVFGGWADHWRRAMYSLAGRFAEQLEVWGEIFPDWWEEFWEEAVMEAEDESIRGDSYYIMDDLYGMGDPEEEYAVVVADTEERVRELWPEIKAVAENLMERGRLEGDEVARIIERAREQRDRGGQAESACSRGSGPS